MHSVVMYVAGEIIKMFVRNYLNDIFDAILTIFLPYEIIGQPGKMTKVFRAMRSILVLGD